MPFNVKRRGKLTYYSEGDAPVLSNLVVETQPDGDLKLYFSGLTGGSSAAGILGRDEIISMDPEREIPLVFQCWEQWLQEASICQSIADVDFVEIHAFRAQPKSPNPVADPAGYARELERLSSAYSRAYADFFKQHCPENGLPARFTVHVVDFPDRAASYEFYATALYQRGQPGE